MNKYNKRTASGNVMDLLIEECNIVIREYYNQVSFGILSIELSIFQLEFVICNLNWFIIDSALVVAVLIIASASRYLRL